MAPHNYGRVDSRGYPLATTEEEVDELEDDSQLQYAPAPLVVAPKRKPSARKKSATPGPVKPPPPVPKIPPKVTKAAPVASKANPPASTSRHSHTPLQPSPSRPTLDKNNKLAKFKYQPPIPTDDTLTASKKRDDAPGEASASKRVRREEKVVLTVPEEDEDGNAIAPAVPAPVERARSASPPTPAQARRTTSPAPTSSVSSSIDLPLKVQARLQQAAHIDSKLPRNEGPPLSREASPELRVPSPPTVPSSSTSRGVPRSAAQEAEIMECVAALCSDGLDFPMANATASTSALALPDKPVRRQTPSSRLRPHQPTLPRSPAHRVSLTRPSTPPRPSQFTHSLIALSPEGFSTALRTYLSARQSTSDAARADVVRLEAVVRERDVELGRLVTEVGGFKGEREAWEKEREAWETEKEGWKKEREEGMRTEDEGTRERERLGREVEVLREVRRGLLGERGELEKRVGELEEEKREREGRSEG